MWIGQPLKAPEPMCKECLSASYNQNLTLQSFGGNEKRDSARNNGSSGACGPNQRQRLKGNHVERNNEATGLQIWIEKETDPCAIWCHLAAGSTTQRFSCRWNLQGDSSDSSRGLLNLLNRWCWDHSTVDWTLDVTQPETNNCKKWGGPPLLIDLIDQKLAVSRMIRWRAALLISCQRWQGRHPEPGTWLGTQTVNVGELTMLHSPYS